MKSIPRLKEQVEFQLNGILKSAKNKKDIESEL